VRKEGALIRSRVRLCSHHGLVQFVLILACIGEVSNHYSYYDNKGLFIILVKTSSHIGST
jgi:hypothetical protein